MATRQGTSYLRNSTAEMEEGGVAQRFHNEGGARQQDDNTGARQQDDNTLSELSKMVQVMLTERELREADQREERQRWEMERQMREEEALRREEQTRAQLAVLETLVQGVQLQG